MRSDFEILYIPNTDHLFLMFSRHSERLLDGLTRTYPPKSPVPRQHLRQQSNTRAALDTLGRPGYRKQLVLTDGMRKRSEPFFDTGRLTVRAVSNEDIFLFRLIAGRDDDIEEMNLLVQAALNYDVVKDEPEAQIDFFRDLAVGRCRTLSPERIIMSLTLGSCNHCLSNIFLMAD